MEGRQMAKTGRGTTARRNRNTVRNSREMYVQGNAVKRLQEVPQRTDLPEIQERRRLAQKRKQKSAVPVTSAKQMVSRQAQRNREKAMAMNKGFVLFLTAVSIAVLFTCINYLQVKSEITASMKNVANLESELAQLKEDNDAYYSQVTSTVDISEIKKKAIDELGMKYPSEDQIQTYTTEGNSYVRQYQDVDTHK